MHMKYVVKQLKLFDFVYCFKLFIVHMQITFENEQVKKGHPYI